MNYYLVVIASMLSSGLFGAQAEAIARLTPEGNSAITSYLQVLPEDVRGILAQQLIHAYPALFPPVSQHLTGHTSGIRSVSLTPDGKWALTGSSDNTARLWDLTNPASSPRVLEAHTNWISSVALTPDGRWALTESWSGIAELCDLRNPDDIKSHRLEGHREKGYFR